MNLINGEFREYIEVADRGFQYGDGLFETIAVINQQPVFLDRHINRIKAGCFRLQIPFPSIDLLITEAHQLSKQSTNGILKLILTRGSGGRGYRLPDIINTTRVFSLFPPPNYPVSLREQGIIARFCDTRLGLNPLLAGIKHLNRLEQIMARSEWTNPDIKEGIMLDINGHIIEGTMTNLFYYKNNALYTSELAFSGVKGIMRGIIIEMSFEAGFPVEEHAFTKKELLSAEEIFVCNSIVGIWPIKQIDQRYFNVGLKTRQLQQKLAQFHNKGG